MLKKVDPTTIVFSPGEAREAAVEMVRQNRSPINKGIPFGIHCLDAPRNLLPLKRGELLSLIGRPRNGKTQLMMNTALVHVQDLEKASVVNHATVVASWEQPVEAMVAYGMARHTHLSLDQIATGNISDSEMQLVENYPIVRAGEQLFFLGFSNTIQARRPPMTVEVVAQALETIRDWNGVKNSFVLDLVVLD